MKIDVQVDYKFLLRVLIYLESHKDEGDYRETWKSDQLKRDINELIDLLGLPESRKQAIY